MSDKYKMYDDQKAYFVTLTVVDWVDVFTRKDYKIQIVDSLKYYQKFKGLEVYGWCLMTNHLHMIAKATGSELSRVTDARQMSSELSRVTDARQLIVSCHALQTRAK